MHTRTIAAALMVAFEEAMDRPEDIPHIVSEEFKESASIVKMGGVYDDRTFFIDLDDGSSFRVDVTKTHAPA
jgi:hypothetical protein